MDVFRYFAMRHPKSLQNIRNLLIINDDNLIQQEVDEVRKDEGKFPKWEFRALKPR